MTNELPCVNCLILPICKSKLKNILKANNYFTRELYFILYDITEKCSLLHDYLNDTWYLYNLQYSTNPKIDTRENIAKNYLLKKDNENCM